MKKSQFVVVVSSIFLLLVQNSFASSTRNLTVFAEPNMAIAVTKIAREFSRKNDVAIAVNFNLSPDLLDNIDSGEPMDVLITAHADLIGNLKHKGLVDVHSAGYIAKDYMVLVANKKDPKLDKPLHDSASLEEMLRILDQRSSFLLIDQAENSGGKFASDLLHKLNLNGLNISQKASDDKSPTTSLIREAEGKIYALLLASQIKGSKDLAILSGKTDLGIFYQALVIAGDNMEVGREFIKFLRSDDAKKILTDAGFESLDKN